MLQHSVLQQHAAHVRVHLIAAADLEEPLCELKLKAETHARVCARIRARTRALSCVLCVLCSLLLNPACCVCAVCTCSCVACNLCLRPYISCSKLKAGSCYLRAPARCNTTFNSTINTNLNFRAHAKRHSQQHNNYLHHDVEHKHIQRTRTESAAGQNYDYNTPKHVHSEHK